MAAAQATGSPETERFPDLLWPWVEEIIITHHETGRGSFGGGSGSSTSALMDRGIGLSVAKPCRNPKCKRGKVRNGIVWLECEFCFGTGELLYQRPSLPMPLATKACEDCGASGRRHPRSKRWAGIRPDELACCVACQGRGFLTDIEAAPNQPPGGLGVNLPPIVRSWVGPTFEILDQRYPTDALVLDVMYGGVGREAWRRGHRRMAALWPLTQPGQRLLALVGRVDAGEEAITTMMRPIALSRRPLDTLIAEAEHADRYPHTLKAQILLEAEDAALDLHKAAREALWLADAEAGHRVLRTAESLHRKAIRQRLQRRTRKGNR